jgi:hypothetical protein
VDAERSQLRVLLRAADEVHGGEVHLAHALGPPGRPVLEPGFAFLDPPAQHPVDGRPADPQVGRYGLHAPAVEVQRHHSLARLLAVRALVVGLEEARELQGDDLFREDPARGVLAEPPARPDVDDVGDLVVVEPGVLGLELHDHPADGRLQALAPGTRGGRVRGEQAQHPVLLEALEPAVHGALRGSGLPGPLRHGGAEQGHRPEFLVVPLLRPRKKREQFLPFVGRLRLTAVAAAHSPPSPHVSGTGRMPQCHARGQSGPNTGRMLRLPRPTANLMAPRCNGVYVLVWRGLVKMRKPSVGRSIERSMNR